ncbi:MAG: GvpL/GvpF family gas vesicle protein [Planctomycetota bacterium]
MSDRLYLYAITGRLPPVAIGRGGVQGAPVFVLECGPLAAVVSRYVGLAPVQVDAESALCHEGVVEELFEQRATLPVRFGTVMGDESHVRQQLGEREGAYLQALDKVQGRVELGVRVLWVDREPSSAPPARTSGRDYLMDRLKEERRFQARRAEAQLQAGTLCGRLGGLAEDTALQLMPTPGLLFSAAFLVDRENVTVFGCEVARLEGESDSLRFLLTGPWPAYSFVGDELSHASIGGLVGSSTDMRVGTP